MLRLSNVQSISQLRREKENSRKRASALFQAAQAQMELSRRLSEKSNLVKKMQELDRQIEVLQAEISQKNATSEQLMPKVVDVKISASSENRGSSVLAAEETESRKIPLSAMRLKL